MGLDLRKVFQAGASTALEQVADQLKVDKAGQVEEPSLAPSPSGTTPAGSAQFSAPNSAGSTATPPTEPSTMFPTWAKWTLGISGGIILIALIALVLPKRGASSRSGR